MVATILIWTYKPEAIFAGNAKGSVIILPNPVKKPEVEAFFSNV